MAAISPHVSLRTAIDGRRAVSRNCSVLNDYCTGPSPAARFMVIAGIGLLCLLWAYAVVQAEWNALFVGLAVLACVLILIDFRLGVILLMLLVCMLYCAILT